ncbi:tetratricopeptide repeat protein [Planctobacterium marinum]|uniref:tetratricopeptide repeat protein n=1 Tax=Planctobacterium marinum TaxID=1631968 RepID=UPI001E2A46CD|nr:hypothetical protein [Planctobacterium marinum]MCC2604225.1 hypothetical protein [Planctobacterium marinum]
MQGAKSANNPLFVKDISKSADEYKEQHGLPIMAEAERQQDVEFEDAFFNDAGDDNESPEFSLEDDNDSDIGDEFSLEESDVLDDDIKQEIKQDITQIAESPEQDAPESSATPKTSRQSIASSYSDDILSDAQAEDTQKTSDNAGQNTDDEFEEFEYSTDIDINHSAGLLHSQQAHQLEMSLLERIDDLIQVLEKRAKGSTPEQLPHKQFATGIHYIKHEKNHYLGAKWLRKAAMQGHGKAQLYLGMLFLQGNGVPKSLFHAYAWFSLAVCQNIDEAVDARKKLERHLTAKDINAALKYAADILDKIHSPL